MSRACLLQAFLRGSDLTLVPLCAQLIEKLQQASLHRFCWRHSQMAFMEGALAHSTPRGISFNRVFAKTLPSPTCMNEF